MDNRPALGLQRPLPPQRALTGSYALQHALKRTPQPSRLNNVRSVSQPVNIVDLTADGARIDARNAAAFLNNADRLYASPHVINLDDDDKQRPAKRAKTAGRGFRAGGNISEAQRDAAHQAVPGSPLPSLPPRKSVIASRNTAQRSRRALVHRAARRANGLEPPSIATRLPAPKLVADFHPWNGHHAEDILTETVVKGGYFDKAPAPNSAETTSAKPTIWSNLSAKNNMGLQTLSYLFTSVMEKRQAMGRVTAPSTFKPPPRVTVTDTKREAWLRDLANPDVPLRKQSRTIPHGVRGKLLMEQCLGKDIPMPRAVWLAKCVGANELRAFRRKGVSGAAAATGEAKWVREWTVSVEQFLDGVIACCGQAEWQLKMDYAVKLATSFYTERLLERHHYLDWIVTSFAQAPLERLPIWIILAQLYWKDITAFGRRGRQLAEAILGNLHSMSQARLFVNDTLKARLHKLLMILAATNRGCLILPKTWQKYGYLLAPRTATPNDTPAHNILRRNARLVAPLLKTPQNTRCALLRLYSMLDSVALCLDVAKLSAACLAAVRDINRLVSALLNWSASVFRPGLCRIYLAGQVMSQLRKDGQDTDSAILGYLGSDPVNSVASEHVHRVLVELVRRDAFSAGRYMQWLISSGALSGGHGSSMATALLPMLPRGALSPHLLNTRHTLMNRLKMIPNGDEALASVEAAVLSSAESSQDIRSTVQQLSSFAKLELAERLVARVVVWAKDGGMSLPHFCCLRDTMETIGDLQALATILEASIHTDDTALLATICDTISMYGKAFAAIGCLQSMVDRVSERYRILRAQQALDRSFILALTVLLSRFPEKAQFIKYLDSDLAICDQQTSLAVCSPASDNLISMHASSLDSDSDIDSVFASGNTMDEHLMQRVFSRIVQRAGKASAQLDHGSTKICSWLNQLRAVDANNFDSMARSYAIAAIKNTGENTSMLTVICALVAGGCLRFDFIIDLAKETKSSAAASSAVRLLCSTTIINGALHPVEAYRYRVQQKRFRRESAEKVIPLLVLAIEDPRVAIDDDGFHNLVMEYAVYKYADCIQALRDAPSSSAFLANCGRLVTKMLNLGRSGTQPVSLDVKSIVALADPLSVVQCTGALAFLAKAGDDNDTELLPAVLEAIANGCEVWPQLLEVANQQTIAGIYKWAKEQVLNNASKQDGVESMSREEFSRVLDILDVAHHAAKGEDSSSIIGSVTEKLRALEPRLSGFTEAVVEERQRVMFTLQVLMHLTILYSSSASPDNDAGKQTRCNLLAAVCMILVHPGLQSHQEILEYIHDAASTLADTLPAEALASLGQSILRNGKSDPRLASILGTSPPPDAWLALVSQPQPQGSSQARALMKQAANQQQMAGRGNLPSPVQQTSSLQKAALRSDGRSLAETKTMPFALRRWEIMSDATPMVGDNDTSLSLSLFGARKV
ncbi:hypothetical protein AC578_5231 [Pseudocercospora eumusae]|uniref:Mediator of RNA polymerase II transcription subunit 12 n=1 Tax=Pseudocercospora eumusae TaxID=321146 RepID=A0A139HDS6_9PEZI|nr:hypothetical protein AC578_5231 [Pseudocercospora eumusae]